MPDAVPDPVRDVLDTFRTAAALPAESLGAYVITMASRAVGRARGRAASEAGRKPASAARGAAVRNRGRSSARRGGDRHAPVAALVSRAHRGTSGGDGRLLRFGEGCRPLCRGLVALPRAGRGRRRLRPARRPADAVPRPRRQRRPRRRPDPPRDSIAAARFDRRPAARDRAGRDDPGEVRPSRHRRPNDGGVHDRDARSDARAGPPSRRRNGGPSMDRLSERARASYREVVYENPRLSRLFSRRDARARAARRPHRQPAAAPGRRRRRRGPARDPLAVRVDADAVDAAVVARRRGCARRNRSLAARTRC